MTVLSPSAPPRSSRFASTVLIGPITLGDAVIVGLGNFSPTSTTWSFVTLQFAPVSVYEPANLPIV
jgi:hypothetical protein